MVRDPLSNFVVRLKNAQAVKKQTTLLPYNKFLWEITKLLEQKGYLSKIDRRGKRVRRAIEVAFVYDTAGRGRIDGIRRISRQSKRVYKKAPDLHPIKHGQGFEVVSTSRGVMTGDEARKMKVGGEVLFEIW